MAKQKKIRIRLKAFDHKTLDASVAKINKLDYEDCKVDFEDNTAKVTVKVALNEWKSTAIDNYTDTLTFTAEIV